MNWLSQSRNGVIINLKIVPRSSRTEICGVMNDMLKIKVQAPPVDGRANEALLKFIAKKTGIARNRISMAAGETGRVKRVEIRGATKTDVIKQLAQT